jgi:hypothetical protein
MLLLLVLLIAVTWVVTGVAVAALCRAAAVGDGVEVAPSWDDLVAAA